MCVSSLPTQSGCIVCGIVCKGVGSTSFLSTGCVAFLCADRVGSSHIRLGCFVRLSCFIPLSRFIPLSCFIRLDCYCFCCTVVLEFGPLG